MNKGLKNYTKQIKKSLDGSGDIYVNVCKQDANVHAIIPLLSSVGPVPIETSLIFNYQNRNDIGIFGKGVKLNWYGKVCKSGDGAIVKNADGYQDVFKYNAGVYKHDETNRVMDIMPLGGYSNDFDYRIKDKHGNVVEYESYMLEYPKKVKSKNGDTYVLDFIASDCYISNERGDKIVFKKGNGTYVTRVEWQKNNTVITYAELAYSGDHLSKVTYKRSSKVLAEIGLSYSDTQVMITDLMTSHSVKATISSGLPTELKDGYGSDLSGGTASTITYPTDLKTVVTDQFGNKTTMLFDKAGLPIFEMDAVGRIVKTVYDKNTKAVVSQSTPIDIDDSTGVISADSLSDDGISKVAQTCNDGFFKSIVGENTCKFTTSDNANTKKVATYDYSIDGIATDSVTAIIWGKQLTKFVNNIEGGQGVVAKLIVGNEESQCAFTKTEIDDNFDVIVLGVNAKETYSKATLKLEFYGNNAIEIGKIQIIKKSIGAVYTYGEAGNIEGMIQGSNQSVIAYDSNNNPIEAVGSDGTEYTYEYDSLGNVTRSWGAYNVHVDNEYDATLKSNVTKQTISNVVGDKKIITSKEYDSSVNAVSKEVDERGNATKYQYNKLGNVTKITDALDNITEFNYDNDAVLTSLILKKGSTSLMKAEYTYDSAQRISSVSLENGSKYGFKYDDNGNIVEIKINDVTAYTYEYDANGMLKSQGYGNGDKYIFDYENGLIQAVKFKESDAEPVTKYEYVYDDNKRLVQVNYKNGTNMAMLYQYEYDENDRVVKQCETNATIEKTYDNVGNVATQLNTVNGAGIYQCNEPLRHSRYYNTTSGLDEFKTRSYVCDFSRNAKASYKDTLLAPVTHSKKVKHEHVFGKTDKGLRYVHVDSSNLLSYMLPKSTNGEFECGNIEFWFWQDSAKDAVLFSCKGSNQSYMEVRIVAQKLVVNVIDKKGVAHNEILTSEDTIRAGGWNFFAFDFHNRCDGEGYMDECRYRIMLNGVSQMYRKTDPRLYVDVSLDPIYNIGHGYNNSLESNAFSGKITCLRMLPRNCTTENDEKSFYDYTMDYSEGLATVEVEKIEDHSATNIYTFDSADMRKYDVYPLQKDMFSLKGKKPIAFDMKTYPGSNSYKEQTFDFDSDTMRYAYLADGQQLTYEFGDRLKGTAIIRAKLNSGTYRQIFESKDRRGRILGVYVGANNKLFIDKEGTKIDTGLVFTNEQWHTVGLSFKYETVTEEIGTSGYGASTSVVVKQYFNISVMLDDQIFTTRSEYDYTPSQRTIMIGRKFDDDSKNSFGGLMESLAIGSRYITQSDFITLADKLNCTTKVSTFDEFGMYQGSEIRMGGGSVFSNNIEYDCSEVTENEKTYKKLSHIVASEAMTANGETLTTRTYVTDKLGRVTSITDGTFGSHSYEYDNRGFLVKEDSTTYEYDSNGNVKKAGNVQFVYDETVKDKLVKVGDKEITYDTNNPLVPMAYNGNTYSFEGRRLMKVLNGNMTFKYNYNDQGLRISKYVMGDGVFVSSRYFYDGTKLIADYSSDRRLDFLYDENDRLFGLVLNETDTYFYVRDTLENILGIIDSSGNLVVKYTYDAWGKIQSITGSKATTIGKYNPFRYKGYYYDDETDMYYCHTRYYVPEWCRWLNADNACGLDLTSLCEQNLNAYCNNDPINYYDPTGHSAVLLGLILGAIIGAGLGFGVAAYKDYKDDGEVFNGSVKWYDYAGATLVGGALGASIGYAIPTIGTFMGLGGGMSMSTSGAAVMSSSIYMVGAAGLAGSIFLFSKGEGPRHGHNQYEKQQWKEALRRFGITDKDRIRRLHNEIHKYPYQSSLKGLMEVIEKILKGWHML